MSQFSSTQGTADKDGELVKFCAKVQRGRDPDKEGELVTF